MLGAIMQSFWTYGKWIPNGYNPNPSPSAPGDVMQDIFGQSLVVGSMVKLIGTITSVDPLSAHFADVTFVPQYPQAPAAIPGVNGGIFPQNQLTSVKVHPLQLVKVGSWL